MLFIPKSLPVFLAFLALSFSFAQTSGTFFSGLPVVSLTGDGTVETSGGVVMLEDDSEFPAIVAVPAGSLARVTRFTISRLSSPPAPIPAYLELVGMFSFTALPSSLRAPVLLVLPLVVTEEHEEDAVTDLYAFQDGEYMRLRSADSTTAFMFDTNSLYGGFIAVRGSLAQRVDACVATGGNYGDNRCYCPPERPRDAFDRCVAPRARAVAEATVASSSVIEEADADNTGDSEASGENDSD